MSPLSFIISVVVPVYSGEKQLRRLVSDLTALNVGWKERGLPLKLGEIILVDDASIDNSPEIVDELATSSSLVTGLHLARNYGQHPATIGGIVHSSGDWVVTMDEDLQHSPAQIETLLRSAILYGSDVVYATANEGVHEAPPLNWVCRGFERAMVTLSGNPNAEKFSSFRLMRGPLARAVSSVCSYDTHFDVALSWFTTRVATVQMPMSNERYIKSGHSGYRFSKRLSHVRRMLLSSQIRVLRFCSLFGLVIMVLSSTACLVLIGQTMFSQGSIQATGWTSPALISLFFGGLMSFTIGVALEYISTLALVAHGKPVFFTVDRSADRDLAKHFGNIAS